jgi:cellulose synthase/poly-beta-1,6-N-acetylglucosamine synthase-like glycosyltransferase
MKELKKFGKKIDVIRLKERKGNKSHVQEIGISKIVTDVFITTDADTILHTNYIEETLKDFQRKEVFSVAGYVKSSKHNWITASRELDYIITQDLHKYAQSIINSVLIVPGCASAFRTRLFKKLISFDHDTLTEDVDITYKINKMHFVIAFNKKAIVYTQDPATLPSYINQMRRWYSGGWQNLIKHKDAVKSPSVAFEVTLLYLEGFLASFVFILLPFISIHFYIQLIITHLAYSALLAMYGSLVRRRIDLLLFWPAHTIIATINAAIFLEQFVKEVVFRKRTLFWYQPERRLVA